MRVAAEFDLLPGAVPTSTASIVDAHTVRVRNFDVLDVLEALC